VENIVMPFPIHGPSFAGQFMFTCTNKKFLDDQYQALKQGDETATEVFTLLMQNNDTFQTVNARPVLRKFNDDIMGFTGQDAIAFRSYEKAQKKKLDNASIVSTFLSTYSREYTIIPLESTYPSSVVDKYGESGTDSDGLVMRPKKRDSKKGRASRLSK